MLELRPALKQQTNCWCPKCRNELVSDNRTVCKDPASDGLVEYACGQCSHVSGWDFDAPVPLLLHGRYQKVIN